MILNSQTAPHGFHPRVPENSRWKLTKRKPLQKKALAGAHHAVGGPGPSGTGSDGGGVGALAAGAVDGPHPLRRLADAAARPVEGRRAHVPGLLLPLAICSASIDQEPKPTCTARGTRRRMHGLSRRGEIRWPRSYCAPGSVAQQRLRSSTCSTSSPRSQAPSDTSSFANRCRIGLRVVPPRVSTHARTWSVAVAVGTRQTAGTTPLTHRYYEL